MNSHILESNGKSAKGYIFIVAATIGTLSITAESKPIDKAIKSWLPMVLSIQAAKSANTPVPCKLAIPNNIPKKNKTLETSILDNA